MKKIILLLIAFLFFQEISFGQDVRKNRFEINNFQIRESNTIGPESIRVTGINIGYTRYILHKLNLGIAYGFGEFNGRGSELLERFDDFGLERKYRQYQIKLGYDVIQTNAFILGFQAEYLRSYRNGITTIISTGDRDAQGNRVIIRESVDFGRSATPSFYTGAYLMARLHNQFYLKGDASYGIPSMNFDYELFQFSFGLTYQF
jgi:hypothetical protein